MRHRSGYKWLAPHLVLIATAISISGCWTLRAHHLANTIESDEPLSMCIKDAGVEPIELASCIRHSASKRAAKACEPPERAANVNACLRDCKVHIFRRTVCRQPD